ncbi:MAG: PSD1 domain-containing protein [Planctomycetaceae bacterium]|nr:PSD1 domain-containing protein [Planctomycetaceae bacterium]
MPVTRHFGRAIIQPVVVAWVVTILVSQVVHHQIVSGQDDTLAIPTMTEQEAVEHFETQVKPILRDKCLRCHNSIEASGSLNLTTRTGILEGGDSGPALVEGQAEDSLLLSAIRYDAFEMPPTGKLSDAQIRTIQIWLHQGMPWSPGEEALDPGHIHKAPEVNAESKAWWAFQPPQKHVAPPVRQAEWVQNDIDRFVLQRLEEAGLRPNPLADRATLIRRVYYSVLGLPPTYQQVQDFVQDPDPMAYEKLVDQVLASPHYGEKWGRFWLDLVRYSETNSFERDGDKPFVWKYRDYVIRSFNEDKPYDRFLLEQLAGDELPEPTIETVTATGYFRLGQWDDEPADPKLARYDELDDMVRTTSEVMLGLTVGCARCHDHKIDPIPMKDYYGLLAFFENIRPYGVRSNESVEEASVRTFEFPADDAAKAKHQTELERAERTLAAIYEKVKPSFEAVEHEEWAYEENHVRLIKQRLGGVLSEEEVRRFERSFNRRQQLRNSPPNNDVKLLAVKERGPVAEPTHLMLRGNPHVLGDQVEPSFPSVLSPPPVTVHAPAHQESTGRRLALAKWIASSENPLTARVIANRIWQGYFERGLVRSASDYGFQGDRPTHPELLDWLAVRLVEHQWRMKPLQREILLSNTFRMSSSMNDAAYALDPNNDKFWRYNMRRLTAEEVRDSILAAAGHLNLDKMFGPSIFPIMPQEVLAGQSQPGSGWGQSSQEDRDRRSIYIKSKRSLVLPIMKNFDVAEADFSCPVRFNTTQPTQALGMLNSEFTNTEAQRMAQNILKTIDVSDVSGQVAEALRRTTQRTVDPEEIQKGVEFVHRLRSRDGADPQQALARFCLLSINLNEFLFVR